MYCSVSTARPLCVYVYKGSPNVCGNVRTVADFAWNLKLLYAFVTEMLVPRRKFWMCSGWVGVLLTLLALALYGDSLTAENYIASLMVMQLCVRLDVIPLPQS